MRSTYPFTAVVGQERMKRALVLNAINPQIGGVLIRGERGTAKSTAARALAALIDRVRNGRVVSQGCAGGGGEARRLFPCPQRSPPAGASRRAEARAEALVVPLAETPSRDARALPSAFAAADTFILVLRRS